MTRDLVDNSVASCVRNERLSSSANRSDRQGFVTEYKDCEGRNPWPWSLPQLFSGGGIDPSTPPPMWCGIATQKVTHVIVEQEKLDAILSSSASSLANCKAVLHECVTSYSIFTMFMQSILAGADSADPRVRIITGSDSFRCLFLGFRRLKFV